MKESSPPSIPSKRNSSDGPDTRQDLASVHDAHSIESESLGPGASWFTKKWVFVAHSGLHVGERFLVSARVGLGSGYTMEHRILDTLFEENEGTFSPQPNGVCFVPQRGEPVLVPKGHRLRIHEVDLVLEQHDAVECAYDEEINRRLRHDDATDLLVRKLFDAETRWAVRWAFRMREEVSLVAFDIDRLKQINDRFGHTAGALAIESFGKCLQEVGQPHSFATRFGGDEFALLLVGCDRTLATEIAERVCSRLSSQVLLASGRPFRVSATHGLATFPHDALDAQTLFRAADDRLVSEKSRRKVSRS